MLLRILMPLLLCPITDSPNARAIPLIHHQPHYKHRFCPSTPPNSLTCTNLTSYNLCHRPTSPVVVNQTAIQRPVATSSHPRSPNPFPSHTRTLYVGASTRRTSPSTKGIAQHQTQCTRITHPVSSAKTSRRPDVRGTDDTVGAGLYGWVVLQIGP